MKVRAKHWLNFFDTVKEHAEKVGEAKEEAKEQYVSEIFPPEEQPKRRGRPKKTED